MLVPYTNCRVKFILKFRCWEYFAGAKAVWSTSNSWPTALEANDWGCIRPMVCRWRLEACPYCVHVSLLESKTDQYTCRKSSTVLVARSASVTCPVAFREQYFRRAEHSCDGVEYVFWAIVHTKAGECLRRSGNLSCMRVRELMKHNLSSIGYDAAKFWDPQFLSRGNNNSS